MAGESASFDNAMAAAVAAAAELAKNGGISLYHQHGNKIDNNKRTERAEFGSSSSSSSSCAQLNKKTSLSSRKVIVGNQNNERGSNNDFDNQRTPSEEISGETMMIEGGVAVLEDAEKRLARSRERNREHARRTRLRKKAQLEALQSRVKELEEESRLLKQKIEECSIASILVGLSSKAQALSSSNMTSPGQDDSETKQSVTETLLDATALDKEKVAAVSNRVAWMVCGKRKRFISEAEGTDVTSSLLDKSPQPLKLNIDGQITLIGGGKTHINWKSGVYCDESGVQRQLTQEQLESLRRERNRMHAKMTRDRKKCFIAAIEKTIEQLETHNQRMRDALNQVAQHHQVTIQDTVARNSNQSVASSSAVTPISSPIAEPIRSLSPTSQEDDDGPPDICAEMGTSAILAATAATPQEKPQGSATTRRVAHGFTLSVP